MNKELKGLTKCSNCGRLIGRMAHECPQYEDLLANPMLFKKGMVPWNKGWHYKGEYPKCTDCNKTLSKKNCIRCRTCNNKYRNGVLATNWRGGITPLIKQERAKFREEIKHLVFERDNYTCQLCGARNGNGKDIYLQVDHIQSWRDYVELRFSIDNCRTLCMACHYEVTFGRKMPEDVKFFGYNSRTRRKL